jgi:hypothetical protein
MSVPEIRHLQGLLNSIKKNGSVIYVKIWSKPQYKDKAGQWKGSGDPFYISIAVNEGHKDAAQLLGVDVDGSGKPTSEKSPTVYIDGGCSFTVNNHKDSKGTNWVNLNARLFKESRIYINGKPPAKGSESASDPAVNSRIPDAEEEDQF